LSKTRPEAGVSLHPYAGDAFHARRIGGNRPFAEIHYTLLGICLPLFLLTPVFWSVSALRHPSRGAARLAQRTRAAAGTLCVVNLLFLAGMVVVVANGRELFFGITPLARAVLLLPLLSAMLTGITLFLAVLAWRRGYWSLWRRLHYSLLGQ